MSSEIMDLFYAKVRAHQYLHYLISINFYKNNYLPVLRFNKRTLELTTKIANFYPKKESNAINNAIFHNIVHNRRTFLYGINKQGEYDLTSFVSGETDAKTKFDAALVELNKKMYKDIDI